jgi:hypothetical protein
MCERREEKVNSTDTVMEETSVTPTVRNTRTKNRRAKEGTLRRGREPVLFEERPNDNDTTIVGKNCGRCALKLQYDSIPFLCDRLFHHAAVDTGYPAAISRLHFNV